MYRHKKYPRYAVMSAVAALAISSLLIALKGGSSPLFNNIAIEMVVRSTLLWLFLFLGCIWVDRQWARKKQATQVIEGTTILPPARFNKVIRGDGIGIPCLVNGQTQLLKIPSDKERYHCLIAGDSGTGKSTIIHSMLLQARTRGETCIIYDPSCEFWKKHSQPGDLLLHPLSPHCPNWQITREITNPLNAKAVANSFLPDGNDISIKKDFWNLSAQRIFRALLLRLQREGKGTAELLGWLREPKEIEKTVERTEHAYLIDERAPEQQIGVLASLSEVAELLSLLPTRGKPFSFHDWSQHRRGWIFIGTRGEEEREALRPLISAWLDIALGKLMLQEDKNAPLTRIFLDELPSLRRLPKLKSAVTEGRKYNVRFCLGFQGRSQVCEIYGKAAEALLSTPATKIILRTSHYEAAAWGADIIGKPRQERPSQSYSESYASMLQGIPRDSFSHRTERFVEHLIIPNTIQNLEDRTGYLRFGGYVTPIRFDYVSIPPKSRFPERQALPERQVLALPSPSRPKAKAS